MTVDPKQVQTVFLKAVELPAADRTAFLDRACAGNTELRERVESFLVAHEEPDGYLDRPLLPTVADVLNVNRDPLEADHFAPGACVGPYRIVEPLGAGGMGSVWVAEQELPVKRRVALKIIRTGLGSGQVVARFEAERQALALMDHPNIAKIIDAGAVGSGEWAVGRPEQDKTTVSALPTHYSPLTTASRPYFVMELIKGVPITTYCDERNLSVRERLELFVPVCRAIEHAHQKGIIHRDIKPGNVLVCAPDGKPVPKVIDFGIAKALGQKLSTDTVHTGFGVVIGSVHYMSPEQAEPGALDVDTRADVYGLGTLLYELLTGTTPIESSRLAPESFLGALRAIREEEPPPPSTRLSTANTVRAGSGVRQGIEPARRAKEVRGELDWIVMKCLEKDRSRRYDSAGALARDVERYLRNEPVEAGPPSVRYRVKKFVRRNRGAVLAVGAVLTALVLGVVGTTAGLVRAMQEGEKAKRAAENERLARESAERRLGQVEKAADVLGSIFYDIHPAAVDRKGRSLQVILASRLDYAAAQLADGAIGDPLTVARLEDALGSSYVALGYPKKAIFLLEHARQTRETLLGPRDRDTLATMNALAGAYRDAGRLREAVELYETTLRLRRDVFGPRDPGTLATMNNMAVAYRDFGRYADALVLCTEVHNLMTEVHDPLHEDTLMAQSNLASAYLDAGRLSDALALFRETLCLRAQTLPAKHPDVLRSMSLLAGALLEADQPEGALPLCEETLRLRQEVLGPLHPETLGSRGELAVVYRKLNQLEEATTRGEEALRLRRDVLGPDHPHTLLAMNNLAVTYDAANRPAARPLFEEVLQRATNALGPEHPDTLRAMVNLGATYRENGAPGRALPLLKGALELTTKVLEFDHPDTLNCADHLACTYLALKQPDQALAILERLVPARRKRLGASDLGFARFLGRFGWELIGQDRDRAAEKLLRECLTIRQKREPEEWTTFEAQLWLGCSLLNLDEFAAAEEHFLKCYDGLKRQEATLPPKAKGLVSDTAGQLVELYDTWGEPGKAAEWRAKLATYAPK